MDEETDKLKNIQRKVERGIVISRIPKEIKDIFITLAKTDFCDDYGMALREVVTQYIEYQEIKHMLFNGRMRLLFEQPQPVEAESTTRDIKTLSGKVIKVKEQEAKKK